VATRAFHSEATGRILLSGGIGHSTPHLYEAIARHPTYRVIDVGRPESHIIRDIPRDCLRVDPTAIQLEDASSNCGEVAREVRPLRADGYGPRGRNFNDHVDIPEQVLLAYRNITGQTSSAQPVDDAGTIRRRTL
jgi:hypothetical protein